MDRCLVFGGQGFIGRHLVEKLLLEGYEVKVFDISAKETINFDNEQKPEIITGDFLDPKLVNKAMKDIDFIFHHISLTHPLSSITDPNLEIKNLIGTLNILNAAVKNNIEKVIFPSSGGTIYGHPNQLPVPEHHPLRPGTPYSITKVTIEYLLGFYFTQYDLNYSVLRISNPYGPGQVMKTGFGVIPTFLEQLRKGQQPIIFGDGSIERDYIYISDLVKAHILAIEHQTKSKIFNVGSGKGTSLNQLIDLLCDVTGKDIIPEYRPPRELDIPKIYLDITPLKTELKWHALVDIKSGLEKTWSWINTQ